MFYCQACATKNNWPGSFRRLRGRCEVCGVVTVCHDSPTSSLPLPPKSPLEGKLGDKSPSIQKKGWNEFRDTGLLWLVNTTLHVFGWVLVIEKNAAGDVTEVYPARTTWRGFSEEANESGFKRVRTFMGQEGSQLADEVPPQ